VEQSADLSFPRRSVSLPRDLASRMVNHLLDQVSNLFQAFPGQGLESEYQHRLCIGGPHQTPSLGKLDPDPIHIDDGIPSSEEFCPGLFHQPEFELVRAIHTDLGCCEGPGDILQQLRDSFPRLAQDLEQAARGIDAVIKAEIPILENMWPLISPANTASTSRIFALIREWPTFHMIAFPPRSRMSS